MMQVDGAFPRRLQAVRSALAMPSRARHRSADPPFSFRHVPLVGSLAAERGLAIDPWLASAKLPADAGRSAEITAPLSAFESFLEIASAALGEPHLGITIATSAPRGTYTLFEFIVRSSPTTRDAASALVRFIGLVNPCVRFVIEETDAGAAITWSVPGRAGGLGSVLDEFTLALLVRFARELAGAPWAPARAWLASAAPRDTAALDAFLRCPVRFGGGSSGMEMTREFLDRPCVSSDRELHQFLRVQGDLQREARASTTPLVARVREELIARLGCKDADVGAVGAALAMSPRTLQRRLSDEGASFASVLDQTRRELAERYLARKGTTATEVAYMLGYADLRSFDRAFRRWHGRAPRRSKI